MISISRVYYNIRIKNTRPLAKYERRIKKKKKIQYKRKRRTNKTIITRNKQYIGKSARTKWQWKEFDLKEITRNKYYDSHKTNEKKRRKTAQSEIFLISVDFMFEIVRDKFEISSIYGCSLVNISNFSLFMI